MTDIAIQQIEEQRLVFQRNLDGLKTQLERNRLGQFATPPVLALDILEYAQRLFPDGKQISFFEPAFGTGSFYSALLTTFGNHRIERAEAYEIDEGFWEAACDLWERASIKIINRDFTRTQAPQKNEEKFNLLISNPPYVRHHHLTEKDKTFLQKKVSGVFGKKLSGLAGLYCYFIGLAHEWMQEDGIAAWLIPSEFMDVNYGGVLKDYLKNKVTLIQIHRFDPNNVQFDDALVSSAVIWFKKAKPSQDHEVIFSYGGSMALPNIMKPVRLDALSSTSKWTRIATNGVGVKKKCPAIGDFFEIRRGLATGDNKFFILDQQTAEEKKIPKQFLKPILPSPRYLKEDEIRADRNGIPRISNPLYLLDCRLMPEEVREQYPDLWAYYQEGEKRGVADRYLCSNRTPWYANERRDAPIFACTYIGRPSPEQESPFRFILNHSEATISNTFLGLYPKPVLRTALKSNPALKFSIWEKLKSIPAEDLISEGRIYGGGMYKLEPKELMQVPAEDIAEYVKSLQS